MSSSFFRPDVAIGLNNLATLLQATNLLEEAEPMMRRALEILLKFNVATRDEHPNQRRFIGNYTALLQAMGMT